MNNSPSQNRDRNRTYTINIPTSTQLFLSCINNDLTTMKSLIQHNADINSYANLYNQPALELIKTNNGDISNSTQQASITITTLPEGDNHNTLLHAAILSNSIEMLQYVINDLGINNFKHLDYCGHDALSIAIQSNSYETTKYLIEEYGLDINHSDPQYNFLQQLPTIQMMDLLMNHYNLSDRLNDFDLLWLMIENRPLSYFSHMVETYSINVHIEYREIGFADSNLLILSMSLNKPDFIEYLISKHQLQLPVQMHHQPLLIYVINVLSSWNVLKYLIETLHYDPHVVDQFGNTLLHVLVTHSQVTIELVDYVINDLGIDPNILNAFNFTPIYTAGSLDVVKHLLQVHNVDLPNHLNPLLHIALRELKPDTELLELLHQRDQIKPFINKILPNYHSPLEEAARYCSLEIVQSLLQYNAIIPTFQGSAGLLEAVVQNDDPNVLNYFIQHPNIKDHVSKSLFNSLLSSIGFAAENYLTMQFLRDKCDPSDFEIMLRHRLMYDIRPTKSLFRYITTCLNVEDKCVLPLNDRPAPSLLFFAMKIVTPYGFEEIKHIVEHGGNIYRIDEAGQSLLHITNVTIDVIDYFIQLGFNVNVLNNEGQTILHGMLQPSQGIKYTTIQQVLFKYPSIRQLIDVQDHYGQTVIHKLCRKGHNYYEVFKVLLSYTPNVNIVDNDHFTPVLLAMQSRQFNYIKLLLTKTDCDIYTQTPFQETILHLAINCKLVDDNDDDREEYDLSEEERDVFDTELADIIEFICSHKF